MLYILCRVVLYFIPTTAVLILSCEPHLCALAAGPDAAPVLPWVAVGVPAVLEAAGVPVHAVLHHAHTGGSAPNVHAGTPGARGSTSEDR